MTIFRDFSIFQDGGRPPSWICDACVGTELMPDRTAAVIKARGVVSLRVNVFCRLTMNWSLMLF